MIKCVIFDFNRTVYDPEKNDFCLGFLDLSQILKERGIKIGLISTGGDSRLVLVKNF